MSVLDKSDITTILVALRLFQNTYRDMDAEEIAEDWPDYFEPNRGEGDHWSSPNGCHEDCPVCAQPVVPMPLGSADIDTLCEKLNSGKVTVE